MQTTEATISQSTSRDKLEYVITFMLENLDRIPLNPLFRMPIAAMGQVFLGRLGDLSNEDFDAMAANFKDFIAILTDDGKNLVDLEAYLTSKLPG